MDGKINGRDKRLPSQLTDPGTGPDRVATARPINVTCVELLAPSRYTSLESCQSVGCHGDGRN